MDLLADSVQGVIFPIPGQRQDDALGLWGQLFPSQSPDGFQKNTSNPSLQTTAQGQVGQFNIVVAAQVGRIDVFMHQATSDSVDGAPLRIRDIAGAFDLISVIMHKLSANSAVARIAIVVDLAKTVAAGEEVSELRNIMPQIALPENAKDVSVQFNSRRPFDIAPDIEMNRLAAWTGGQAAIVAATQGQGPNFVNFLPYVGVKYDVNSAPERQLPTDKVDAAIDEIISEARIIVANGVSRFIS